MIAESVATASTIRWRARLDQAIGRSKKERGSNYVQIATVDEGGSPHCRSVVMRGFETAAGECGDVLRMLTDTRTDKIAHTIARPECELHWWFGKSSEQFRISGRLEIVHDNPSLPERFAPERLALVGPSAAQREALMAARKQQWGNLSDNSREGFFSPTPGTPLGAEPAGPVPPGGRDAETGKVVDPPATFALLLLRPRRVDYLCLHGNVRQIDVRDPDAADGADCTQWTEQLVVG